MSADRIENPDDHFKEGQQVRVKIIKMDPVENKVGLSIKAALDEPDPEAVQAYFDQPGDGSATLSDVMSHDLKRSGSEASGAEQDGGEEASSGEEEAKADSGADEDDHKEG